MGRKKSARNNATKKKPVKAVAGGEEQRSAEESAAAAAAEYTPDPSDMQLLNSILNNPSWEAVEARVAAVQAEGNLTENLVQAAVHLLGVCQARGEPKQVTQMLEKVASLMAYTITSSEIPPEMKLIDELCAMEPEAQIEPVKEKMESAFKNDVNKETFLSNINQTLTSLRDQNEPMEELLSKTMAENQSESFTNMIELVKTRKIAIERMKVLVSLAESM